LTSTANAPATPTNLLAADAQATYPVGRITRQDASQTEPLPGVEPVPLEPPREPITGDSHAHLLNPLGQLAAELGYSVREIPLDGGTDGWCDSTNREIVVNALLSTNARVRVLVHECAHALGVHYSEYGRHQSEVLVLVDTVIFCPQKTKTRAGAWAERA
jgi:hypothetical protein